MGFLVSGALAFPFLWLLRRSICRTAGNSLSIGAVYVTSACKYPALQVIFKLMAVPFLKALPPAASEAARKSESGKGKLDESQGRKASGLHDFLGHLPAGLPSKMVKIFDVASPFIC